MPLYEYKCHRCNQIFEVIQKFSDPALTVHEECGGELERLISAAALQFKGTGWYVTDYAGNGKGAAAAKANHDGKPSARTEGQAEGKTESKPDSKPGSKTENKPAASTPEK